MKDDLEQFYTSILTLGTLVVNDEAKVKINTGDSTQSFLVDRAELYLPTQEVINRNIGNGCVFHPLAEKISRSESDVHAAYRKAVNITLNASLRQLILTLVIAAKSKVKELADVPHTHLGLLALLKDADEKMVENLTKMFKRVPLEDVTRAIVNVYIKPNAVVDGTTYRRAAIVTFPMYDDLVNKPETLFGATMRKTMDPQALRGILEYVFPDIQTVGMYSAGSMSDHYPTLDCLLRAVYKICLRINTLTTAFGCVNDDLKKINFDLSWKKMLDDADKLVYYSKRIPLQPGAETTPVLPQQQQPVAPNTPPPLPMPRVLSNQPQLPSRDQHQSTGQPTLEELRAKHNNPMPMFGNNGAFPPPSAPPSRSPQSRSGQPPPLNNRAPAVPFGGRDRGF